LVVDIPRTSANPDGTSTTPGAAHLNANFRVTLAAGRLSAGEYLVSIVQQRGNEFSVCGAAGRLRVG